MARAKGSANFSGTIEPLAGGALDARDVVQAKSDLTASGTFPYPYIGMETYVVAENKKYRLIAADPTVLANWEDTSDYDNTINKPQISGVTLSGNKSLSSLGIQPELTAGTNITIENNVISATGGGGGSSYTAGDGIVIDNDEISTDNMPAEDMAEIVTPLPSLNARLPILFDETGAERVVGWYKLANGTKKPVYEYLIKTTVNQASTTDLSSLNIENIYKYEGAQFNDNYGGKIDISPDANSYLYPWYNKSTQVLTLTNTYASYNGRTAIIIIQYTKSTDTPV